MSRGLAPVVAHDDRTAVGDPIIQMRRVVKRFGGVLALDRVDFELRTGEVHALLGENGAGKSTLIKVLAGVEARDGGDVRVGDAALPNRAVPADLRAAGLGFVHQDLGLIDELSVAENLALSCGYRTRAGLIDFRGTRRRAEELLARVSVDVPAARLVRELSQDEKVMVAVARAFALGARAIVLDEVSSSLPAPEVGRLCEALVRAKRRGVGFVYVTHRLDELYGLADRVTVLRDGRRVATAPLADVGHDEIVRWIIGDRPPSPTRRAPNARNGGAGGDLVVCGLEAPGLSAPVSLTASRGEIVGVCGAVGSGAHALAAALGGASGRPSGTVTLSGERLELGDPVRLRRSGCAYVPGDRPRDGAIGPLSVRENLFVRAASGGHDDRAIQRPRRERARAVALLERFRVRPPKDPDLPLDTLSGGNQQKVVVGRSLRSIPRLLVVDDPTAGVDVGARADLHRIIRDCADAGAVVLLVSTDFDEVAAEADRALVMAGGAVVAEIGREDLTSAALARASYIGGPA